MKLKDMLAELEKEGGADRFAADSAVHNTGAYGRVTGEAYKPPQFTGAQLPSVKKPNWGKVLGGAALKGADEAATGITSTVDALVGEPAQEVWYMLGLNNIFGDKNPISALNDKMQESKAQNQEFFYENANRSRAAQLVDKYGTMTAAAIPQAVMALMSGGSTAAAQGTTAALTLNSAAASAPGLKTTIDMGIKALAKDPNYWMAFSQTYGNSYDQAKADGAEETKAAAYALTNSLFNALVEVGGGGIQTLPGTLKTESESALRQWINTMIDEGKEEVVQGVIERGLQNLAYGKNNPLFSTTDENAIFNPATAAQEAAGGAIVGGLLGGGQIGINSALNMKANTGGSQGVETGVVVADTSRFDGGILVDLNQARKHFINYAHEHFPASVVNAETGREIGISRTGLDKFLSGRIGREKYASGFHLPELIERAHKVGEAENYHEEKADSIPTYEYYDSPIEIDGRQYSAHIRVKNTLVGDKYYGHTVSEVDNIKIELSARASASENPTVQSVNAIDNSIYGNSVTQETENSNTNSRGGGTTAVDDNTVPDTPIPKNRYRGDPEYRKKFDGEANREVAGIDEALAEMPPMSEEATAAFRRQMAIRQEEGEEPLTVPRAEYVEKGLRIVSLLTEKLGHAPSVEDFTDYASYNRDGLGYYEAFRFIVAAGRAGVTHYDIKADGEIVTPYAGEIVNALYSAEKKLKRGAAPGNASSLATDTLYITKKKNSHDTGSNAGTDTDPTHHARSEPPRSSSNNSIIQSNENSNNGIEDIAEAVFGTSPRKKLEEAIELSRLGATPSEIYEATHLTKMANGSIKSADGVLLFTPEDGILNSTKGVTGNGAQSGTDRAAAINIGSEIRQRGNSQGEDAGGDRSGALRTGHSDSGRKSQWDVLTAERKAEAEEGVTNALNLDNDDTDELLRQYGDDVGALAKDIYEAYLLGDIPLEKWARFVDVDAVRAVFDAVQEKGDGLGARTAEFGYDEAPTQTHSSDGLYTAEEAETPGIRREDRTHKVNHDVEVDAAARQRYDFDYEGEKADLFNSKQDWDDADTVLAHMILKNEVKKARETNSPEAWKAVAKLQKVWDAQGTTQGQALRQRSRFVNTPEAMIAEAAETLYGEMSDVHIRRMPAKRKAAIMKTISDMAKRYDAIKPGDTVSLINLIKDLNTVRRTTGMFSKETSSQMSWALDYYAKNFEGAEEYLRSVAAQQVRSIAGDYQKTSILEAIKSFRILGMLSKINTVLRNLTSNNIFDPLDSLSNNLSVPMDKLLSKYTGTRSVAVDKSWFSKAKRHGSMEGMLKSFIQVGLDAEVDGAQSKYEQRSGRTFKMTGNPIERLLSTWAKFENYALQTTDEMQKGGIKAETQRGLEALADSGKITNDRKSARRLGEEADTYADERSTEIAKQRTFQNDSMLSNAMVKARELGNLAKVTDSQGGSLGVGDMSVPFAKVPGNVAAQGANYSPLGIIKGIGNLVKTVSQAQNGTLTVEQQAKAVTDIGRGLTGTTALAGFVALALKGIINVAGDDDKDEEALKKASGATGTQINLSALWRWVAGESTEWQDGDTLVSMGFLEPFNALMAAGSMIADSYVEDGSLDLGEILNASVSAVVQAVLELPAMSSIRDLVDGYRYSDKETAGEKVGDALGDFAAGQAGSFIPNFIGGIASGMDDKVRDTYASDSFLGRGLDSVKAKIPGLRQTLPAKLDNFGNERTNTGDWIANMFNSNILPGQINRYKTDEVKDELYRLSEAGAGVSFPARSAPGGISIGLEGEKSKISLNPEEKREYLMESGQKSYEILSELMKTAQYKDFSDEDRVKAISDAYAYARVVAAHKIAQSRGEEYESKEYDPYIKAEENGFDYTHYWQYRNAPDTDGSGERSKAEYMAAIRAMDSELTPEQRAYIRADLRERWKR